MGTSAVAYATGLDVELAATVQHGRDPQQAFVESKGCLGHCTLYPATFPMYGVGGGIRAGAALNVRARPFTLRPYVGLRYEHFFESRNYTLGEFNHLAAEAGLGVSVGRLEFRPLLGVGGVFVDPGNLCFLEGFCSSAGPVFHVGFELSVKVVGGLTFGMLFHYDMGPTISPMIGPGDTWVVDQPIDSPVVGLELGYRFRIL